MLFIDRPRTCQSSVQLNVDSTRAGLVIYRKAVSPHSSTGCQLLLRASKASLQVYRRGVHVRLHRSPRPHRSALRPRRRRAMRRRKRRRPCGGSKTPTESEEVPPRLPSACGEVVSCCRCKYPIHILPLQGLTSTSCPNENHFQSMPSRLISLSRNRRSGFLSAKVTLVLSRQPSRRPPMMLRPLSTGKIFSALQRLRNRPKSLWLLQRSL